jgi:TonB-dependent starch-binding outer membrane protein SusC
MRNVLLVLTLLGCVLWQPLYAQDQRVTGTVRDATTNEALPGVAIQIKGTGTGTVTDMNGAFALNAPGNATLVFSFIGYTNQEVPINNRTTINIQLREDVEQLSEVVVVGYGVQEKRDATGAVASVKAEDFNQGVIASPEQLIQGKTAGVQITQNSGEPGGGINIRVRGTSSVRGGNNPLFVVDGVPLSGEDVSPSGPDFGRGGSSPRNPLNFLNPNDIASIDILKDASATAIYGSRGANGVILITTKSGRGRKMAVEYGTVLSVAEPANRLDLLNRDEFLAGAEALGGDRALLDQGGNTDWQDVVLRTSFSQRHDISLANSHKGGNFRVSGSYDKQNGIVENSSLERFTSRLNFNQGFLNDRLTFGLQGTASRINDEQPAITNTAGFEGDLIGLMYFVNPTWSADPTFQPDNTVVNPASYLAYFQDNTKTNRYLINTSLDYDITSELNFRVNGGYDYSTAERAQATSAELRLPGIENNGRAFLVDLETQSRLLETVLSFNKDIGTNKLSALAGYSYQRFHRNGMNIGGWGFEGTDRDVMLSQLRTSSDAIRADIAGRGALSNYQQFGYNANIYDIYNLFPEPVVTGITDRPAGLEGAVDMRSVTGSRFENIDELQSFFGRANYSINDRYLFTATLRADGSTRFGGNNKYGVFPSLAFKWRLSDEAFVPELFSDLGLRVGWGVTGNQEIPHNLHQQRRRFRGVGIDQDGNIFRQGTEDLSFRNPFLRWEQTGQLNLGLDFGFFAGRLSGSLDLYRKNTTDLLIQRFSAQPAPQPFFFENLDANIINQGVELELNYALVNTSDFGINLGFNAAYNHNEVRNFDGVLDTGTISGQGLTGAFAQRIASGYPLYTYFLREFTGFNEDGVAQYVEDAQVYTGKSPLPLYNIGINTTVRYKQFDLSAYMYGQFGHYVYNNTANAFFTAGSLANGRNVTRDVLTSGESRENAPDASTRFLEKGDFLRMQNLNLGYTANVGQGFVKGLRVFASAQNLFVLTDYSGVDPEVNVPKDINGVPSAGIDYTAYPRPRTYSLGLNVTF